MNIIKKTYDTSKKILIITFLCLASLNIISWTGFSDFLWGLIGSLFIAGMAALIYIFYIFKQVIDNNRQEKKEQTGTKRNNKNL